MSLFPILHVFTNISFQPLMTSRSYYRSSTSVAELDLRDLKGDLRSFIEQSRKGNQSIKELVSREHLEIRKLVSSTSIETNKALGRVDQRLDRMVLNSSVKITQAKRERLLQSLKYLRFNERRNQVSDAYENTEEWIFAGDCNEVDDTEDPAHPSDDMRINPSESRETAQNDQADLSDLKWDSFSNWLRSMDKFYWISGKPGSGKSTLVKFILGHSDTRRFLDVWHPRTLFISHFFWRPGTALQQNVKGLLCSLLYQLLQNSNAALHCALSTVRDLDTKDANTDWSTTELVDLCLQVLSDYDQPLCIFLDGLDEVDPRDGVVPLLSLIDKISHGKRIKICLSSRPEPLLQTRLSKYPQLRLQDLNRIDLELYAQENVKIPDGYTAELHNDPITLLVDRAEGVFLWLVLAIKSINKGVEYGDSTATFLERIDQLPGDLISLYKDMWKRVCDDNPLAYRQTAALYFKLLLAHRDSAFERLSDHFTTLSLMLASTSTADEMFQAGDKIPESIPKDIMLQKCRDVERKANVCCFGLIELLRESDSAPNRAFGMYGHHYDELILFTDGSRALRFIHRSAHDFLVDTEDGKEILDFDKSSNTSLEIRIAKAYLAGSQLFLLVPSGRGDVLGASFAGVHLSVMKGLWLTHKSSDDWSNRDWEQLLHYCEMLCHAGKLFAGSHTRARLCQGEDFLKILANTCGDEHILSAMKEGKMSKSTISDILLNACNSFVDGIPMDPRNYSAKEFFKTLLVHGADPNYKGIMFSPGVWHWPFAQLETPFTKYLEITLVRAKAESLSSEELYVVLETLHIFISHGANLDGMVTFFFDLMKTVSAGHEESVWVIQPLKLVQARWRHPSFVLRDGIDSILFASVPAHSVLDALLYTMRHKYAPLTEETKFRDMLSFLENECINWNSSERSRAFGRVHRGKDTAEGSAWFETIEEHQERIADKLMDHWRNWEGLDSGKHSLPNAHPRWIEVEESASGENIESLLSLCEQAPWALKASGEDAIRARFEELGIFTRVDKLYEIHSTECWVGKQQA